MSYVQTIGWDDYFVPPALQLFSDGCYFIFNCGENSQRFRPEINKYAYRFRLSNKLGLAKIRYIFLTNLSAHSFCGLPSFILSLDGCNTSHVTIFGPTPIKKVLDELLNTFHELKIEVTVHEIDCTERKELLKFNSLTISGLSYHSKSNSNFTVQPIHVKNVGYLVEFDDVPGIFNPELAKGYGVSKGPDFGRLKKGFDVTLPDGSVLKSNQVCEDPTPGNQILILDHKEDLSSMVDVDYSDCLSKELDEIESDALDTIVLDFSLDVPKLTFLGTGCSVPSVYRNVSAIILQIYENHSLLLDAGEGTALQMLYTCKDFDEFVKKILSIKVVFISHSHADHHLGLYYILALQKKFKKGYSEPTLVICSDVVLTWLQTYNDNICKLDYKCLVLTEDTETVIPFDKSQLRLAFFKVDHIFDSFGIRLSHEEVGTIVYSGDTRPCEKLMTHSENADILIHEATFTDDYSENAIKTFHTTISEAVDIGVKCNVRNLFVTHFSQRFQTIPNDYNLDFNLIMGLDLMTVPVSRLNELGTHLQRFNTSCLVTLSVDSITLGGLTYDKVFQPFLNFRFS
ncbi:tRNA 3' processing endoribonuclease [Theileria orientalis]|uniref:ribonuclease Z n=1 Tax=Theileria orientalis TaxID=68886 RepID=A0A976M6S3_THEOR|nr:tRNA 3' processing endoribonuclease [Theileria orientalis]